MKRRKRKGPVTRAIEEAIERCRAQSMELTIDNVCAHTTIGHRQFSFDGLFEREVRRQVIGYMKDHDMPIVDFDTRPRKSYEDCTADELEVQNKIERQNVEAVHRHLLADVAVEEFLRARSEQASRSLTAGEFRPEVEEIYAGFGFPPPSWDSE